MKRNLNRLYHYNSLLRVMNSHPEVFCGRSALLEAKAELERRTGRLSEIISELSSPLCLVYSRKKVVERELNEAMIRMTNLGCLDAHLHNDATMYAVMKTYRSQVRKVACRTLYYNAMHTARLLRGTSTATVGKDFLTVTLPAFTIQVAEFGRVLEEEAAALQRRKVLRSEMAALVASTNKFLHEQFDTMAHVMIHKHPDYYSEWVVLRGDGSRKRRKTNPAKSETDTGCASVISMAKRALAEKSEAFNTVKSATEFVADLPAYKQSYDQPVFIPDELKKMLPVFMEKAVEERRFVPAAGLRLINPGMNPFTP
ncbi:MAG TPA: hypothetical protein PLP88_13430, partial [Bacteroidales bacterium]|nr:hypothetical protein [Bacteroidales bacterium]